MACHGSTTAVAAIKWSGSVCRLAPSGGGVSVQPVTQIEIVGFRYPDGYLPYLGGMVTIYGQNGAGKSLLLESIESSLRGGLVGRTAANGLEHFEVISSAAVVRGDVQSMITEHGPGFRSMDALDNALMLSDGAIRQLRLPAPLWAAWRALHRELSSRTFAVLAPSESTDREWTAYVATAPDSSACANWDSELAAHIRTFASADDVGDDGYSRWWEAGGEGDESHVIENCVSDLNGVVASGGIYRYNGATVSVEVNPFGTVISDGTADSEDAVTRWIRAALRHWHSDDGEPTAEAIAQELGGTALGWVQRANEVLQRFLLDPPVLRLRMGDPISWMLGDGPRWETSAGIRISALSDAERRWSRVAIALAAPDELAVRLGYTEGARVFAIDQDSELAAPILVVDEPERGLHRAAETHLAAGLIALARTGRVRTILATHSPALLDDGQGQIFRITKRDGGGIGELAELGTEEILELKSFGLEPSSLLRLDRGYLLVEGEHDKQILEGWFADELAALRVSVLAMRGTRNLWTVFDSEFLIERTDALLMPLLDDVALDPLFDVWSQAEAKVADGRPSDATAVIRRGLAKVPGSAKGIYEPLLTGSITRGVSQRFFPLGMAKKDVLEYLPVGEFVDGATAWADLRREWTTSPASVADRSGKAYKDWLRRVKRADFSPENLRLIAETTAPHPELKAVIAKVAERLTP